MFNTPKLILVPLTIGNEQKTISLVLKFAFSGIYDIIMDKEYQGQVQYVGTDWIVQTIKESSIKMESYEEIAQAIRNTVRPNS